MSERDLVQPEGMPLAFDAPQPPTPTVTDETALLPQFNDAACWPAPMKEEAWYGLLGDIVRAISPHSEADEAALLVQALAAFGNVAGHGPHWYAEDTRHALNLFCVLVGETSKGRKGTSGARIRNLFKAVDPLWRPRDGGMSSGEGLVYAVRDPGEELEDEGQGRKQAKHDPGISDKRLFITEEEFGSVLKVIERSGNTLSPVIRQAWDGSTLEPMTKNSRQCATGAHISIVGHVTTNELRRRMTETESVNGFANRFLWVCVKRSKLLPFGSKPPANQLRDLESRLRSAVNFGRAAGEIKLDEDAREIWQDTYPALTAGAPGLYGAVTGRADPQVLRLASIYALADKSTLIGGAHLLAALAIWDYCANSAEYIFGDRLGDPVADSILEAMPHRPEGMTRTDISLLFSKNENSARIAESLTALEHEGRIVRLAPVVSGKGRPVERWRRIR